MRATVNSEARFTVAFTVAVGNRAECDSKKRLRKNYCRTPCVSKSRAEELLSQGGFWAIGLAPKDPAARRLMKDADFPKKKKIKRLQVTEWRGSR
jgi:hypothetical protein